MSLKQKLTSRKFLMALAGALILILNDGLGLGVPKDVYWQIVAIVIGYIAGEAVVDASRFLRGVDRCAFAKGLLESDYIKENTDAD